MKRSEKMKKHLELRRTEFDNLNRDTQETCTRPGSLKKGGGSVKKYRKRPR